MPLINKGTEDRKEELRSGMQKPRIPSDYMKIHRHNNLRGIRTRRRSEDGRDHTGWGCCEIFIEFNVSTVSSQNWALWVNARSSNPSPVCINEKGKTKGESTFQSIHSIASICNVDIAPVGSLSRGSCWIPWWRVEATRLGSRATIDLYMLASDC